MSDLNIEKALIAYLVGRSPVAALVGNRIYPQDAPQNVGFPYATYFRVDGPRVRHLRGTSNLSHPRIQIDCFGDTYSSAKALAGAIRAELDPFAGMMGLRKVQHCRVEDDRDGLEEDRQGGERAIHRVSLDVVIWFQEG